jgi:hypothetical protein
MMMIAAVVDAAAEAVAANRLERIATHHWHAWQFSTD